MDVLRLGWGGSGVEIGVGDTSICGGIGRRVVGVSDGSEAEGKRREGGGETTNNISAEKRDGVLSSDFFNGAVSFFGVALVRMGLLEGLDEVVFLIRSGRVEAERDRVLSGEIGVDKRIEGGL